MDDNAHFLFLDASRTESMQLTRRMYVCMWRLACKHSKSRPPGPIKFKLGVCVPQDEYRNPIVFWCRSKVFWGQNLEKSVILYNFVKFCEILLVKTISPDCLVRSSLNLVCVFLMMSTGTLDCFWCRSKVFLGQNLEKKCDFVKFCS